MQNYDVIWRLYNFPNFTDDFHLHFCDVKQTSIGFFVRKWHFGSLKKQSLRYHHNFLQALDVHARF